jgi:hypothetical protein
VIALLVACAGEPEEKPEGDSGTAPVEYETYACGWEKRDPGTLQSTGDAVGDVLADLTFVDQCGEDYRVWDTYGKPFFLYVTAAWCQPCFEETSNLPAEQARWAEEEGLDIDVVAALYADVQDNVPPADASIGAEYADAVGVTDEFVVGADMSGTVRDHMPWTDELPGKCAVSAEMEILACWQGEDNEPGLEAIAADL